MSKSIEQQILDIIYERRHGWAKFRDDEAARKKDRMIQFHGLKKLMKRFQDRMILQILNENGGIVSLYGDIWECFAHLECKPEIEF